ncbi:hypothetical protein C1646_776184 [Rhizophagus diaphanus]|nr:hypothetical protein C1646_776184 [Rhizophagus diaphanus] [Rhizophagus sp. MUCL 43196]
MIEGFETQSGKPDERQPEAVVNSLIQVFIRDGTISTSSPHLYPTAMSKPMPVGMPILIFNLTVAQFLEGNFYGFLEATVTAPANEYIGLLPIKYQGRLICPGGTFS